VVAIKIPSHYVTDGGVNVKTALQTDFCFEVVNSTLLHIRRAKRGHVDVRNNHELTVPEDFDLKGFSEAVGGL
jgi:hypothetical protein